VDLRFQAGRSSLSLLRSALTIQAGRFVWAENEDRDVVRDSGAGGLTGIHPMCWLGACHEPNLTPVRSLGLARGTEGSQTPRWRDMDSNYRFRAR
jgi:hypothetical protein